MNETSEPFSTKPYDNSDSILGIGGLIFLLIFLGPIVILFGILEAMSLFAEKNTAKQ
jgi:hypothetical protein